MESSIVCYIVKTLNKAEFHKPKNNAASKFSCLSGQLKLGRNGKRTIITT